METSDLLRHRLIKTLMAQQPEKVADAGINLWELMASQIISIIGDAGFSSLYARSVFLTQSSFPWLAAGSLRPQAEYRFAELKVSFEGQTPEQADEANILLLITFTDILAALIGEQLTTSILRSAWGIDASHRADKEFKNE
ncbi:MAG: hypothetical protein QX199_13500 [Methylococcaceae bacterium]